MSGERGAEPDVASFEREVPDLVDPLRRFLARRTDPDTAEDVLADTLLVLWRRWTEVPGEPLPWAYGVARHCLANAERSERRRRRLAARVGTLDPPPVVAPPVVAPPPVDPDPDVAAALAALRPAEAELLRLWAWEGLEAREIATVLEITPNAASIRLHRARDHLREALLARRKTDGGAGHDGVRGGTP